MKNRREKEKKTAVYWTRGEVETYDAQKLKTWRSVMGRKYIAFFSFPFFFFFFFRSVDNSMVCEIVGYGVTRVM